MEATIPVLETGIPVAMSSNVAMLDWNSRQRSLIADKLFDAGNIAAGGMLFGQFVSDRPFSVALAVVGVVVWVAFFAISVGLERRRRP